MCGGERGRGSGKKAKNKTKPKMLPGSGSKYLKIFKANKQNIT